MTYTEAIEYIHSLLRFGSRPGLDNIGRLLEVLGNPQDRIKFIHVAGTNGKGSTCTYISSVCRAAGLKTGLYISPYVIRFNERIQIGGEYIRDDELAVYTELIKSRADGIFDSDNPVTEFEFITALAFKYFADRRCDVVVLEVGLGGRLDATNVIKTPLVSVITRIDLDHTAVLGRTVAEIAREKCGIIKKGCHVVADGDNQPEAMRVIAETAKRLGCRLVTAGAKDARIIKSDISGTAFEYSGSEYEIKLPGVHQVSNAVTAVEAVRAAFPDIGDNIAAKGLCEAVFPARCEVISADHVVILDGSHNPNGITALDSFLASLGIGGAVGVAGFMADKDVEKSLKIISRRFSHIITVTVESNKNRSMSAAELSKLCVKCGVASEISETYDQAVKRAAEISRGRPVVVFGSLYLAGDIRPALLSEFRQKAAK